MSKKFPIPLGTRVRMKGSGAEGVQGIVRDPSSYQASLGNYTLAERLSWLRHPEQRPGQDFFDQGWVSVVWDDDSTADGFLPEELEVVPPVRLRDMLTDRPKKR